jgi:beta-glucosidase
MLTKKAFDLKKIQRCNKALEVDRNLVEPLAKAYLERMSLDDKIEQLHGSKSSGDMGTEKGLYWSGENLEQGIPPLKMVDGPRGLRSGFATAFPVPMARGASFDPALEKRVGMAIGTEVAAVGGNVLLAPTINLLRHPGWGRAQETYSEDPFHMGLMGLAFVCGAQNFVLASPKHFALNNLEITRFEVSSEIEERALHEVYLPHFKRSILEGGAASIMSAYNKVNGTYCGENRDLLEKILRADWGFEGFVESDWLLGTRSTALAINSGMDIEMPAAYWFKKEKIKDSIAKGEILPEIVDRNVLRVLRQKIAFGLDSEFEISKERIECKEHRSLAQEVAEKSFVLLKNEGVLPLKRAEKIALIGKLAATENLGDRGSSMVRSTNVSTPLDGLKNWNGAAVTYFEDAPGPEVLASFDVALVVAGYTYQDEGEYIPTLDKESSGTDLARGGDRISLRLPIDQEELIGTVSSRANKTVVLLETGSSVNVSSWIDSIHSLLVVWYPGCEGGKAIARTLFGEVNPSGRLPVLFPKSDQQLGEWDVNAITLKHGLFHGYRYLDHNHEKALFPFGFGLSYTEFKLRRAFINRKKGHFSVIVAVSNAGKVDGDCVPQLYVSCLNSSVDRAKKELKGFGRLSLRANEEMNLEFEVQDSDLCFYDGEAGWVLEDCLYRFFIGLSSEDLPFSQTWRLDDARWTKEA